MRKVRRARLVSRADSNDVRGARLVRRAGTVSDPAGTISRRQLLKSGALLVGFNLFDLDVLAQGLAGGTPISNAAGWPADQLDSWLAIAPDGTVTVFTSKVDLGTGTGTALGQIVADELDVEMSKIRMVIGDTTRSVDQGRTSASRTLERAGPQMRQAGAAARQELLKRASARLGAPVEQLTVSAGVVSVGGNRARSVSYGALVGGKPFATQIQAKGEGWDIDVAPSVKPKDPKDYKVVGTSVPRMDLPAKFTGEFLYAHEVRVPGMLHGRVVRPAVINSKPLDVDEGSISHIPGIVKVVQQDSFLGIVAQTEWSAIQAARALKVKWSDPPTKFPDGPEAMYGYLQNAKGFREQVGIERGDVAGGLAKAAKKFDATYRWPFQLHAMISPSCAVADVKADSATVWSGSQAPFITRNGIARLLKLPEDKVRFIHCEGSGCYGRLEPDDAPEDAALMSRAVGRPVRVQWMRADEHGWEPKGPAQVIGIQSGLDAQGRVAVWNYVERTLPWTDARFTPMLASRQTGIKPDQYGAVIGAGMDGTPYTFDNRKSTLVLIPWVMTPNPLRTGNLRAPYAQGRCFACESQMDEMALAAGIDPIAFRLQYLGENKRAVEVLRAVAEKSGWQPRTSSPGVGRTLLGAPGSAGVGRTLSGPSSGNIATGRGVAISGLAGTVVAQVADVEVDKTTGKVMVKKITVAHDCGIIVNPDGLRNQIEGNVIQSTSRSLFEEVDFDANGVKNLDWNSYPIIRFRDVPDVDIVLINRTEMPPFGAGEASSIATGAAIANAIFDAVGARLRQAPFTNARILAALKA